MKNIIIILFTITIFIFGVNYYIINSHKDDIRKHFTEQNQEVKTCDYQLTIIGTSFFYCNKGQYIFKVELTNGEVWWVRASSFTNDYEKEKYERKTNEVSM